jgi:hypothetical protein
MSPDTCVSSPYLIWVDQKTGPAAGQSSVFGQVGARANMVHTFKAAALLRSVLEYAAKHQEIR